MKTVQRPVICRVLLPDYVVIPDRVLRAISDVQLRSPLDLARIRGVGPRTLAKFGEDLLGLVVVRPDA
jgi:hypothetical protein